MMSFSVNPVTAIHTRPKFGGYDGNFASRVAANPLLAVDGPTIMRETDAKAVSQGQLPLNLLSRLHQLTSEAVNVQMALQVAWLQAPADKYEAMRAQLREIVEKNQMCFMPIGRQAATFDDIFTPLKR